MEGSWKTQTPPPLGASNKQTGMQKINVSRQPKTPASYTAADHDRPARPTLLGNNVNIKHKSQSTTVPAVSISRTVTDKNKLILKRS